MTTDFRALYSWLVSDDIWGPMNRASAALAKPEGQSSLNVNLTIDTLPENLKRLCDGLAAAVTPNGGYEAATTDDLAPGTGGDQMVQVQWWIPQHGCDSLENTLDAIKYRIRRAVEDWWATALVSVGSEQLEREGPTDEDLLQFAVQKLGLLSTPSVKDLLTLEAGELPGLFRAVLTRWGRPAAPSAPELCSLTMDQVMDLVTDGQMLEPADLYGGETASFTALNAPPPLPANYIDPEHQGEDRELLQTFYRACLAKGGTVDEVHLRGIRAVLAARPAAQPAPEAGEDEA